MRIARLLLLICALAGSASAQAPRITKAEYEMICRAALAAIHWCPAEKVRLTRSDGEILYFSHPLKGGHSDWNSMCRIVGSTVLFGNEGGKWCTRPTDEKISFNLHRAKGTFTLRIAFYYGYVEEKTYPLDPIRANKSPEPTPTAVTPPAKGMKKK